MKTIATLFFALAAATAIAAPKIEVMPELAGQVNAQTTNNAIPWYDTGKYDAMITARLDNLVPLVRTRQGDYDYTLYRVRFHNVKVVEGELQEKELIFYLERQFPTPESGIQLKELWPFQKECVRVFKVKKAGNKLQIVSMEMEPQQGGAPNANTRRQPSTLDAIDSAHTDKEIPRNGHSTDLHHY